MLKALKDHWPEYLMEAAELAIFMISASAFTILFYHPDSSAIRAIPNEFIRRVFTGLAMGLTLVGIVYSPWGKRSGAHMNPAFTLTFWRLGKVAPWDASFYCIAQFLGGLGGILIVEAMVASLLSHPSVNYVVTVPGPQGPWVAFAAEVTISFLLIMIVLIFTNKPQVARFTGIVAGIYVVAFITFESPLSGMSMNPARTFGSAFLPHLWQSLWIYFTAPPLGMLLAAEVYVLSKARVVCAKYHHQNSFRCIFCEYHTARKAQRDLKPIQSTSVLLETCDRSALTSQLMPNIRTSIFLGLAVFPTLNLNALSNPVTFESPDRQVALLELFTSEGCSSCPPAEDWFTGLKHSPRLWLEFVPLAFHVDYWDYLGWRDSWASKDFSDRQRTYAEAWRSDSIYTPGFVLNGKEWRDWSRPKDGPRFSAAKTGVLKISSEDLKHWHVSFIPFSDAHLEYEFHVALLANGLTSDVKAGENRGRRLNHDFVVIALANSPLKIEGNGAKGELVLPETTKRRSERFAIAAWVTRVGRLEPVQAVGAWLPIQSELESVK